MRCRDCDRNLTDEESTRWNEKTKDYWDLCNECLGNFYRDTDTTNINFDFDEPWQATDPAEDYHDGG